MNHLTRFGVWDQLWVLKLFCQCVHPLLCVVWNGYILFQFPFWMCLSFSSTRWWLLCPPNKGITIGFLKPILAKENQCFESLLMKTWMGLPKDNPRLLFMKWSRSFRSLRIMSLFNQYLSLYLTMIWKFEEICVFGFMGFNILKFV